ncbi:transposase [Betaproteobacteria bacterium]|nr:transposase [Betaproteobacteria bacterium]
MPDYRRHRVLGGTYFFTVNLLCRNSRLLTTHIDVLREAVGVARQRLPFHIDAWGVLPDHMHCVWTLPVGDDNYSARWKIIKIVFARQIPKVESLSPIRKKRGERALWQRRFWEHTIRDDRDYAAHVYVNPLKHGLVKRVVDWPYSSFHRDVRRGLYPADWAGELAEMQTGERDA